MPITTTAITERNTVNKEIFMNKKNYSKIKKACFHLKKICLQRKRICSHRKKKIAYIHKANPQKMAKGNSYGI